MEYVSEINRALLISTFMGYSLLLILVAVYSGRIMNKLPLEQYVQEFYTAGRGLGAVIVGFMISAAICSSGTFVGGAGLSYHYGLAWVLVGFSFFFANFTILGTIGKKLGIVCRRINATTYLDIFSARYNDNRLIVVIGVLSIILFLTAYASAQFIGGARMLEIITGMPYFYSLIFYAVVVILYSTLGGIRGVSIAALIQGIAMTLGCILLFSGVVNHIGGLKTAFFKIEGIKQSLVEPGTFSLKYQISLWVTFGLVYIAMPHGVLGVMSYKNSRSMHMAIVVGAIVVPVWAISMNWSGFLARSVFATLEVPDHANPALAVTVLNPFFAGIVIAGAAAAAQSTIATMILAMSGTIVKNLYQRSINPNATQKQMKQVTVTATMIIGLLTFALAVRAPKQLEWIVVYSIGGLASAFSWPMLLGLYWKRANEWGALASMISGITVFILAKSCIKSIAFGMDPIIVSLIVSGSMHVFFSSVTAKPDDKILRIFWGADPVENAGTSDMQQHEEGRNQDDL